MFNLSFKGLKQKSILKGKLLDIPNNLEFFIIFVIA